MNLKFLAVLTFVFAAARVPAPAGPQAPRDLSNDPSEFTLKISSKQADARAGSEVRIEVVLQNVSDHPISLLKQTKRNDEGDRCYRTYVRDDKGNLAPETKYGRK